jgi:hypothetical protein
MANTPIIKDKDGKIREGEGQAAIKNRHELHICHIWRSVFSAGLIWCVMPGLIVLS